MKRLSSVVDFCVIQYPGRGSRIHEQAFTSLDPLIEELTEAILPSLDRPFIFFGHSMGALVSFELTHSLLRKHGITPNHLVLSGHNAPQLPRDLPDIWQCPDDEFIEHIRSWNGIPDEIWSNQEMVDIILPVLRADVTLCETYLYTERESLPCPITIFGGESDPLVSRENLEKWDIHTSGSFEIEIFPGDHFFIHQNEEMVLNSLQRLIKSGERSIDQSKDQSSNLYAWSSKKA